MQMEAILATLFAFTSDFRGCDVHRTTGARDEGPHRLAHDTEPRRGDCDLSAAAYGDLPTRSLGSNALSCGHHIHEASEVEAILSSHLHGARRLAR